jgi:type I restriction enzyme S subunit
LSKLFLFYLLQIQHFQKIVEGSGQPQITQKSLQNFKINITPTLTEQEKIANFLSSVDEKIEITAKKIEKLKDYKKGLLQKMLNVINGEPEIRFKEFSGKWVEKRLGDVCEFYKGKGISKSDVINEKCKVKNEKLYKCIHYGELFTKYKEVINDIFSYTKITDSFNGVKNDLLFPSSDVTPQGLARVSTLQVNNVLLGNDVIVARPIKKINSIFLSYQINTMKKEILKLVTGSTIKHIYPNNLKSLKIHILPTLAEQEKIADFLSSIDEKTELNENRLKALKTYKKGLLQKMFV